MLHDAHNQCDCECDAFCHHNFVLTSNGLLLAHGEVMPNDQWAQQSGDVTLANRIWTCRWKPGGVSCNPLAQSWRGGTFAADTVLPVCGRL